MVGWRRERSPMTHDDGPAPVATSPVDCTMCDLARSIGPGRVVLAGDLLQEVVTLLARSESCSMTCSKKLAMSSLPALRASRTYWP